MIKGKSETGRISGGLAIGRSTDEFSGTLRTNLVSKMTADDCLAARYRARKPKAVKHKGEGRNTLVVPPSLFVQQTKRSKRYLDLWDKFNSSKVDRTETATPSQAPSPAASRAEIELILRRIPKFTASRCNICENFRGVSAQRLASRFALVHVEDKSSRPSLQREARGEGLDNGLKF
ncbi:hypothetical protein KM043_012107 [Ampulex compressa]|nr:hypothetical protein KM043_012107 [Ampulex compressa]